MAWRPHDNAIFSLTVLLPLPVFVCLLELNRAAKSSLCTSSHSPGALLCTCACLRPFFRLMTAAEGLPAAFQGVNASLPTGHFSVDTGWAWGVSSKQDGSLPSPQDQLTHAGLNCPLVGFTSKSPIHQCLQPGLSLPIPARSSIQLYPTPDPLNHSYHLSERLCLGFLSS